MLKELVEKRTRNSKTYNLGGGKRRCEIHGSDIHYKDSDCHWQNIDANYSEVNSDGFTARFTKLPYVIRMGDDGRRRLYPDRDDLSYWVEIGKPFSNMGMPTKQGGYWIWDWPNATMLLRISSVGVKLNFILKNTNAPTSISFPFATEGITRNGKIFLHDGKPVVILAKPHAVDAEETERDIDVSFGDGEVTLSLDTNGLVFPIEVDPTLTVHATSSDAFCRVELRDTWADAYGAADADVLDKTSDNIRAYQSLYVGKFYNHRSFLFFDTSALGAGAVISAAVLSLYGKAHEDDDPPQGDLCVVESVASDPVTVSEYGAHKLKNTLGHDAAFDMGVWSDAGYNDITLNATGRGWINKTGITKFCLRCKGDVDNIAPTQDYPGCIIWSMEKGEGYQPKLVVDYTVLYEKTFTETINLTDSLVKMPYKTLLDTTTVVDTIKKSSTKSLVDNIAISDSIVTEKKFFRIFTDNVAVTDSISLAKKFFRVFSEAITIIDSITKVRTKVKILTDSINVTESITTAKKFFRVFTDNIEVTDQLIRAKKFFRIFTESILVTDTIAKKFSKVFTESITIADSITKRITKVLTELITITDVFTKLRVIRKIRLLSAVRILHSVRERLKY